MGATDRIYLQVDTEWTLDSDYAWHEGVTWCVDRIEETDIEYVRAGLDVGSRVKRILQDAADVICAKEYSESEFDAILDFLEEEPGPRNLGTRENRNAMTITVHPFEPEPPGFVVVPVEVLRT